MSRKLTQTEADALASAIAHWKELKAENPEHKPTEEQCELCMLNPHCRTCILFHHVGIGEDGCIPQFQAAYKAITFGYGSRKERCQAMISLLEKIQNTYEVEDDI